MSLEILGKTQEKYRDFLTPPVEILMTLERNYNLKKTNGEERSLENLMCILKREVQSEEMIVLALTGFGLNLTSKKRDRGGYNMQKSNYWVINKHKH
ncbi:hypothetical protein NPIL_566351 [Nephila pilipes]|uniref:Uncharacterized protein n=1 Tax=Nephila pilipes TaxID=299642 RepID=A0A8X6MBY5_NEPPI|nr:hypothetical protein NPIL_566351 [Nephila pilipes]